MPSSRNTALLLSAFFTLLACVLLSCSQGTEIIAPERPGGLKGADGEGIGFDRQRNRDRGDDDDDDDDGSSENQAVADDFEYPKLNFKILRSAENFSTCVEHGSDGTKQITADLNISLDQSKLTAQMNEMHVWVKSDYQGEADAETAKNLGLTLFHRPKTSEIKELKDKSDFKFTTAAIFADKVDKQAQGKSFTFSKPLPVFAFPVPINRYDELEGAGISWTANVTTSFGPSYDATVTLKKVSESDGSVVVELSTHIPQDTDLTLYEDFPIPTKSTYILDLENKRVTAIRTRNDFHPDSKHCRGGGNRDRVEATYTLCSSEKGGKTETFPCQ